MLGGMEDPRVSSKLQMSFFDRGGQAKSLSDPHEGRALGPG